MWNLGSSRGTRKENAMKRLRARFPFRKWITGKGEFRLLVGTAARFFLCAVSGEPAETRRNAKPDDCSTPFEIHNHLFTTQQGNWLAGQTRPDSSCQFSLAQYCMPTPTVGTDSKSQCMRSPSSSVRRSEVDILEHSTRAASIRDTH